MKAAFDAINLQPDQTGKNIEIQIAGSTTETATALLSQPATASWNSLTIYPTATATIEGAFIGTIIDLNGADNVTINGKLNKTGTAKSLTISHTSNADNGNRTIRLINDAKNNTIQYATITGKCPSNGAGVVFFSTTSGADGNDGNTIEYCDINAMGAAAVGIGSAGTASPKDNSGNIIRGNNIYDFYLGSTSANSTYGINIGANNTDWEISGNSLYQTVSRVYGSTATIHYGISVSSATSNNNTIVGNYIGGSAPLASGTAWTVTDGLYRLFAMNVNVGTTTASSIQGNTVANIDITTGFVSGNSSAFIGIQNAGGALNIGTITANTIGSTTATNSVKVKFIGATVGSLAVGINVGSATSPYVSGTMNISNNKIGGIIIDLNNSVNRAHLYGISIAGTGIINIIGNTIGSTTVANSIEHTGCTYTSQTNLRGITCGTSGLTTISNNIIANLTATSTGSMAVNGIFHNGGSASNVITGNTVHDIKSAGTRVIATQGVDAGLIGIVLNSNSAGNTIGGNSIFNLENTNTTLATDVYGINFHSLNAGASTIEKNKIYNLKTSSTNAIANVVGISITRGLTNTINNMITLGDGITNAVSIVGIRKLGTAATQNNNFYHNTVLINGSEVGTAGSSYTAAFAKVYTATDEVKNNIFINTRSNAPGNLQKHYAVNLNGTTTLNEDNNILYVNGTVGLIGAVATTDYTTLGDWQAVPGLDPASKSVNVNFVDANTGDLRITGASEHDDHLAVSQLPTVSTDLFGTPRLAYTYAGAHHGAMPFYWTGIDNSLSTFSYSIMRTSTGIEINLNKPTSIELYTSNGLMIDKKMVNGNYKHTLNNGIYIVRVNGVATKFVK